MSESMAVIVRSSSNKLMLEVKDPLWRRPLQLLTYTRSGHFQTMISQDRATKVVLMRIMMMVIVLHVMIFHQNVNASHHSGSHEQTAINF
jgi:hypothetical protein